MRQALRTVLFARPLPWARDAIAAGDYTTDQARWNNSHVGGHANIPGWSNTSTSAKWMLNQAGVLVQVAANALKRTDKGLLVEGARTNKSTNYSAVPNGSLTNLTLTNASNALATLAEVSDSAALAAAGLANACTNGNVFKLDNSAGDGVAFVLIGGTTGNTNPHIMSAYCRGTGSTQVRLSGAANPNGDTALTTSYARAVSAAITPSSSGNTARISAPVGAVVYFILNQMEEGAFVSSPIVVAGSSATRAADVPLIGSVTGLDYPLTLYAEFERVVDTGGNEIGIQADAGGGNDRFRINVNPSDVAASFANNAGSTQFSKTVGSAISIGAAIKIAARCAANSARMACAGALGNADATVTVPATPTTLRFGSDGSALSFGYLKRWAIFPRALSDAELTAITT